MPTRYVPLSESEVPAVVRKQLDAALSAYYHACDHTDGEAVEIVQTRYHAGRPDGVCSVVLVGPAFRDLEEVFADVAVAIDRYLSLVLEWYRLQEEAEVARGRR